MWLWLACTEAWAREATVGWLLEAGATHGWLWLVVGRGCTEAAVWWAAQRLCWLHRGDGWLLVTAPGLRRAAGLVTAQGLCRAAGWWLAVRGFVVVGYTEATNGGCVGGCWGLGFGLL
ncbi:hypothetical protein Acr_02g0006990 [Actinidia rufa]|uniref:Uncharacterized protein n=1 Tax=Actinidia rufa TaxID=165716 RepID=A0A7J0E964_9ERIC|nr:hypothetical protein Acr_02g0006990 [Actinidia rufa]